MVTSLRSSGATQPAAAPAVAAVEEVADVREVAAMTEGVPPPRGGRTRGVRGVGRWGPRPAGDPRRADISSPCSGRVEEGAATQEDPASAGGWVTVASRTAGATVATVTAATATRVCEAVPHGAK